MPQFEYGDQPRLSLGMQATAKESHVDSFINELLVQKFEVAIGVGPFTGLLKFQLVGPEGTFTFEHTGAAESGDEYSDALALAIQNDPDFNNLLTAAGTPGSPLLLDMLHPGQLYELTVIDDTAVATPTITTAQAPGGTDLVLGIAVVRGSADKLAVLPGGGSTDQLTLGITVKNTDSQINGLDATSIDVSRFPPSSAVSVASEGDWVAKATEAVGFGDPVFVRNASPTVNAPLGSLSKSAANSYQLLGCRWRETTTAAGLATVRLNRPA